MKTRQGKWQWLGLALIMVLSAMFLSACAGGAKKIYQPVEEATRIPNEVEVKVFKTEGSEEHEMVKMNFKDALIYRYNRVENARLALKYTREMALYDAAVANKTKLPPVPTREYARLSPIGEMEVVNAWLFQYVKARGNYYKLVALTEDANTYATEKNLEMASSLMWGPVLGLAEAYLRGGQGNAAWTINDRHDREMEAWEKVAHEQANTTHREYFEYSGDPMSYTEGSSTSINTEVGGAQVTVEGDTLTNQQSQGQHQDQTAEGGKGGKGGSATNQTNVDVDANAAAAAAAQNNTHIKNTTVIKNKNGCGKGGPCEQEPPEKPED